MRIVVAYKWTCDPEEATVRADGTVDWSRAKPGLSAYDPVAIEVARQFADEAGAELIGVTVGVRASRRRSPPRLLSAGAWTGW